MLNIEKLKVSSEDGRPILKDFSLSVKPGEIHVVMGPNGSGKSTLTKILGGYEQGYKITGGEVFFEKENLLNLSPEERLYRGLFISFQYPPEIPGVTNFDFLKTAYNALRKKKNEKTISDEDFEKLLDEKMSMMQMNKEHKYRGVNDGFSGGEKKKNEILQMAILKPKLSILDEADSGLDIDALRIVASGINKIMQPDHSLVLITHYQRLLNYIKPDHIHVLVGGKIVSSGGPELALELEEKGYDWIKNEK
jgi:Fe-S cluster assembly ATP-binding protein